MSPFWYSLLLFDVTVVSKDAKTPHVYVFKATSLLKVKHLDTEATMDIKAK